LLWRAIIYFGVAVTIDINGAVAFVTALLY
jgi:hypothetical protein